MTQNLVAYWKGVEEARANLAREKETERYNTLYLAEMGRHNKAQEGLQRQSNAINLMQVQEMARSNIARETETNRSNIARESETYRSNYAREQETHRTNTVQEGLRHWKDKADAAVSWNRWELDRTKATTFGPFDVVNSALGTIFNGAKSIASFLG